jgi:hypothetical protein
MAGNRPTVAIIEQSSERREAMIDSVLELVLSICVPRCIVMGKM